MLVYNIRKEKYAAQLSASGVANRWNKREEFVIYTGSYISLSTLEMVVHRNMIQVNEGYKLLFIEANVSPADIEEIPLSELPKNWKTIQAYPSLQERGSIWYQKREKLLLKVPSVIVPWEHNYLINTQHPKFQDLIAINTEHNFLWDNRLLTD